MRLPTHLNPIHYDISLVPFIIPNNFTIKGSISITFNATATGANNITLHTAETNITHSSGKKNTLYACSPKIGFKCEKNY